MKRNIILGVLLLSAVCAGFLVIDQVSAQKDELERVDVGRPEAVVFADDFSYAAASLLTANGWTAHSGGGTSSIAVSASGLTYAGYLGSGTGNGATLVATGEDVSRAFPVQAAGNVYAAVLVNATDATVDPLGGYFFHIGPDPISTTFRGRVFVKKDGANMLSFGISKAGNATATDIAFTPHSFAMNTTHLLVVKYSVVAGATNDTVSLLVNPVLSGAEPAAHVMVPDVTATDIDPGSVALRQGEATPRAGDFSRRHTSYDRI